MSERIVSAALGDVQCDHRKAAIVGAGRGREAAPFDDPSWCVFAINEIWQPSFTRHFELHPMGVQSERELRWLEGCQTPCYVLDLGDAARAEVPDDRDVDDSGARRSERSALLRPFKGVGNAVEYPLNRVVAATGGRKYFTNTFAYELALALADGFEEVGLWGVGLYDGTSRERTAELACLEYWIGVADGRGVKLTIGPQWLARRPYLYGYDYEKELAFHRSEGAKLRKIVEFEEERRAAGEAVHGVGGSG